MNDYTPQKHLRFYSPLVKHMQQTLTGWQKAEPALPIMASQISQWKADLSRATLKAEEPGEADAKAELDEAEKALPDRKAALAHAQNALRSLYMTADGVTKADVRAGKARALKAASEKTFIGKGAEKKSSFGDELMRIARGYRPGSANLIKKFRTWNHQMVQWGPAGFGPQISAIFKQLESANPPANMQAQLIALARDVKREEDSYNPDGSRKGAAATGDSFGKASKSPDLAADLRRVAGALSKLAQGQFPQGGVNRYGEITDVAWQRYGNALTEMKRRAGEQPEIVSIIDRAYRELQRQDYERAAQLLNRAAGSAKSRKQSTPTPAGEGIDTDEVSGAPDVMDTAGKADTRNVSRNIDRLRNQAMQMMDNPDAQIINQLIKSVQRMIGPLSKYQTLVSYLQYAVQSFKTGLQFWNSEMERQAKAELRNGYQALNDAYRMAVMSFGKAESFPTPAGDPAGTGWRKQDAEKASDEWREALQRIGPIVGPRTLREVRPGTFQAEFEIFSDDRQAINAVVRKVTPIIENAGYSVRKVDIINSRHTSAGGYVARVWFVKAGKSAAPLTGDIDPTGPAGEAKRVKAQSAQRWIDPDGRGMPTRKFPVGARLKLKDGREFYVERSNGYVVSGPEIGRFQNTIGVDLRNNDATVISSRPNPNYLNDAAAGKSNRKMR